MIPFQSFEQNEFISNFAKLTNPFGVYAHIPFCVHKCSYCDFYSFTRYDSTAFERLVGALSTEVAAMAAWLRSSGHELPPAVSLFVGGGTPSLLPATLLSDVFAKISAHFPLATGAEITMEANPETLNETVIERLREHTPINRISLGAQSFQTKYLDILERLCKPEAVRSAASLLRSGGYANFNVDLIFAIPGQTLADVESDLQQAMALEPKHISFYNLTLKPGHRLYSELPDDDTAADLYERGCEILKSGGYVQYEISNFCRPGFESQHNLLYWNGGDYLGLGPSASSRFFWDDVFHHRKQVSDNETYVAKACRNAAPEFDKSSRQQTLIEATFLELRRNAGVDVEQFAKRYGCDLRRGEKFKLFLDEGFIQLEESLLTLTPRGRLLADTVTRDLADTSLCGE
jgi:oxygen-independent coproporphyrinogen-3 oxidase